jgi:hypothetical protein
MASLALEFWAVEAVHLLGRDGSPRRGGLVLGTGPVEESFLESFPLSTRGNVREQVDLRLLAIGEAELEREERSGRSSFDPSVLRAIACDGPDAGALAADLGLGPYRVAHAEAAAAIRVVLDLDRRRGLVTELVPALGGPPASIEGARARYAGRLLWREISGTIEPGPFTSPEPDLLLARLRDEEVPADRRFRGALRRR